MKTVDIEGRLNAAKQRGSNAVNAALCAADDIVELRVSYEKAEAQLAALELEYGKGSAAIGEAASRGDADDLAGLSLRMRELPTRILAADFKRIEAELALIAAERKALDGLTRQYTNGPVAKLQAEIEALQLEIRCIEAEQRIATERATNLRHKRIALEAKRHEIMGELRDGTTPPALRKRQ